MVDKTIGIGIDPSKAQSGGRVVKTELRGIADEAQKAENATVRLGNTMAASIAKAVQAAQALQNANSEASAAARASMTDIEIALLKAQQAGANFARSLDQSFATAGKSAREAAAVFLAAEMEAEELAEKAALLRAQIDPLSAAQERLNAELAEYAMLADRGAISTTELAAAQSLAKGRFDRIEASMKGNATATRLAAHEMRVLQFQMIDIAQSIPLAFQSPLYFLQNFGFQAAQISQIFMGRGGMRAAIVEIGGMLGSVLSRFARFVPFVGAVALGFEAIRDRASEAQERTIGLGETATAAFQTVSAALSDTLVGRGIGAAGDAIDYAFDRLGSAAVDIAELVINSFHAAYVDVTSLWSAFPDMLGATFVVAVNNGIGALNLLVKKSSDAVDSIIAAFNSIPGVDIPLIGAADETIPPIDNAYLDNLKKAVADRNAEIERIMASTPLRDFADTVGDRIQRNRGLSRLDDLAGMDFSNAVTGANHLASSLGGVGQAAVGTVRSVASMQDSLKKANLATLASFQDMQRDIRESEEALKDTRETLASVSETPIGDVFGENFAGDATQARSAIDAAVATIQKSFAAMDEGRMSARGVNDAIEMVRMSLEQIGDDQSVNRFIDAIVNAQLETRDLTSLIDTLSKAIRNMPTRIGTGMRTEVPVPGGAVGVTRYGGGDLPSQASYSVPSSGGGTGTVGVTSFSSTDAQHMQDATTAAGNHVYGGIDRLSDDIGGYVGDLGGEIDTSIQSLNDVWGTGVQVFYKNLSDAIRTSIVTGMAEGAGGRRQFTSSMSNHLDLLLGSNRLEQIDREIDRLQVLASTAGSLASDAIGLQVSNLELEKYKIEDTRSRFDALRPGMNVSYAGKFADGGSFIVPGPTTGDRNRVVLDANGGEKITVEKAGAKGGFSIGTLHLHYTPVSGESEATSRQRMRAMLQEAQREASRA